MKIVVTGASGFLGRSLLSCLEQRGMHALGVSRRYSPGTLQVDRYEDTPSGDVLFHLAEASNRAYGEADSSYYEQQAIATLKALQNKGFSRVIYASSALLYGDQSMLPRKGGDPVYATDVYTRIKLRSERAVLSERGVVARLANIYGPGMADSNVFSTIFKQLYEKGPVWVLDGTPVRDFLWVGDAGRGLADMVTGTISGVFNIGYGQGVSIYELASRILRVAGQTGRPVKCKKPSGGFSRLVLDISKTKADLGWYPRVPLSQGISTILKMKSTRKSSS